MAKRFTDTNKFKEPFYKNLPADYKLLWDYINLDCDHGGIWIKEFEIAQIRIGNLPIKENEAIQHFNNGKQRIYQLDDNRWFVPSFLIEQYPQGLNSKKPAIVSAKNIIISNNLADLVNELFGNDYLIINEQFSNDYPIIKDKDKDKDKELSETQKKKIL